MNEHVAPGEVYLSLTEANHHMQQALAQTLAGVEAALGVVLAESQRVAGQGGDWSQHYAEGMRAAEQIVRAAVDAYLASPAYITAPPPQQGEGSVTSS